MTKKYAIGIDLGTTYFCVGVFRNDNIEIFQNNEGFRITPSCVSFDDEEVLVGNSAVYQSETNIKNTIFNIKRIIGRDFDEENVQNDIKRFPFKVINKNNRPYVQVKYKRNIEEYTPEEISSNILSEMKGIAEDYLGEKITDAVITVPAYFNDTQRKATIDAGKIAGLNVLQIINEPTAAALAYGFNNKIKSIENILVIDLGGGTYDVSLLSIINGKYEVKAISGDTHFGGEDFNEKLIDYFIEEINYKYRKDIRFDSNYFKIKNQLKSACERCKIQLSSKKCKMAPIEIFNLFDGINFKSNLTRDRFEELNKDLFDKLLKPIKDVINFAKINKSDVNEIALIGSSTHILKAQDIISSYFDRKELKKKILMKLLLMVQPF
ncbi:heat shock protein Hsp70 [Neocallimastix sp. 'constans']|jgi:L1 cell adhesion molecule like protein